ncbi:MAG: hypothetical protein RI575_06045 [Balneolaceae bacterium]|nr:hypothetical protein [Balneolaceae bacterium]MDR9410466.1 hypothetical protein [Balneolaceae bacterium]
MKIATNDYSFLGVIDNKKEIIMNDNIDWFLALIRIAGVSFPVSSSLVQLHAEIDSMQLKKRLAKVEAPISHLHTDIPELSKLIYKKLKEENSTVVEFNEKIYSKFSKALAVLDSQKFIKAHHAIGNRKQGSISLQDPTFILYLCSNHEEYHEMQLLYNYMDECEIGDSLNGINMDIDLPTPVIKAVFKVYESNGYGICSKEVGSCYYRCIV